MKTRLLGGGLAGLLAASALLTGVGAAQAKGKPTPPPPPAETGCRNIEGGSAAYSALVEDVTVTNSSLLVGHTHETTYQYQQRGVLDVVISVVEPTCPEVTYTAIQYAIGGTDDETTYSEIRRASASGSGTGNTVQLLDVVDGRLCVGVRMLTVQDGFEVDYAPDLALPPQKVCGDKPPAGTGWR